MTCAALQVQDTVGGANAVAKEVVFPLFDRLGALHLAISEELRLLVVRHRLYEDMEGMRGQVSAHHHPFFIAQAV